MKEIKIIQKSEFIKETSRSFYLESPIIILLDDIYRMIKDVYVNISKYNNLYLEISDNDEDSILIGKLYCQINIVERKEYYFYKLNDITIDNILYIFNYGDDNKIEDYIKLFGLIKTIRIITPEEGLIKTDNKLGEIKYFRSRFRYSEDEKNYYNFLIENIFSESILINEDIVIHFENSLIKYSIQSNKNKNEVENIDMILDELRLIKLTSNEGIIREKLNIKVDESKIIE
jgi:hypothetical protein